MPKLQQLSRLILTNFRYCNPADPVYHGKAVSIEVSWPNSMTEHPIDVRLAPCVEGQATPPADGPEARMMDGGGRLWASPGWAALGVGLTDPGFEWRDDLHSLAESALQGGFTELVCWPNTKPVLDTSTALTSLRERTQGLGPRFRFMGALTHRAEGRDMAELLDLLEAGAVAFSDGTSPLQDPGQLLRSFEYLKPTGRRVVQLPLHRQLASSGLVNESAATTFLGLRQQPALAEEFMVAQCLQVLAYTGGKLHVSPVTTAGSLDLIRFAKAQGLDVTADTAPQYLVFDDSVLAQFDTVYKVEPPLRSVRDVLALREALAEGTLDALSVQHFPQAPEDKDLEFDFAEYGMLTLECAFAAVHDALVVAGHLSLERLFEVLAAGPRQVMDLEADISRTGLTLVDPEAQWTVSRADLRSRSRNCPWLGQSFRGRVVGTVSPAGVWLNDQ